MQARSVRRLTRRLACPTLLLGVLAGVCFTGGAAQAATMPTLSFAVTPTSITLSGTPQSGAASIVMNATGTKEGDVTLLLLKPGVTVAEAEAFLATNKVVSDPNLTSKYGSIVYDAEAPVGTSEAQTNLAPGQYLALNAESQKSSKWPRTSFTVTNSAAPAVLPTPSAVIRAIDFNFRGPSTIKTGTVVGFENEGYVVHMIFGFPVKSKKAAALLTKDLRTGHEKKAGKLIAGPPVGFAGPLSSGGYQQSTIKAKPGYYVLTCFMPTQDGRAHTALGMERTIKIVK